MAKKETLNRQYKATLFSMLFNNIEELLSLSNALTGEHYTSVEGMEINTLENEEGYETGFYLKLHNDLSFIFHSELHIYEHQSTWSWNLPLRMLLYVSDIYKKELRKVQKKLETEEQTSKRSRIYSDTPLDIPAPRFVVFYNGTKSIEEKLEINLSSLYQKEAVNRNKADPMFPYLELKVTAYNINAGHNKRLLESCRLLAEYVEFTDRARKALYSLSEGNAKIEAMKQVVSTCIEDGILAEFLTNNREAVIQVTIMDYEDELRTIAARYDGERDGANRARIEMICKKLKKNKSVETIAEEIEEDTEYVLRVISVINEFSPEYDVDKILEKFKFKYRV